MFFSGYQSLCNLPPVHAGHRILPYLVFILTHIEVNIQSFYALLAYVLWQAPDFWLCHAVIALLKWQMVTWSSRSSWAWVLMPVHITIVVLIVARLLRLLFVPVQFHLSEQAWHGQHMRGGWRYWRPVGVLTQAFSLLVWSRLRQWWKKKRV